MSRTHALDRWLYRDGRAHWLARRINAATARLAASAHGPSQLHVLEVPGRHSGRIIRFPVVVADYEGERYLVSMLGDNTNWIRNVRAAGGHAVLVRGRREPVRLDEIDRQDRGRILRRYLACSPGARSHIDLAPDASIEDLEQLAGRYPIFRVSDRSPSPTTGSSAERR